MNKNIYTVGALALAISMSIVPALVRAESNSGESEGVLVQLATNTNASGTPPVIKSGEQGQGLELEDAQDIATSSEDLNSKIRVRMLQFAQGEASSSPQERANLKNTNEVRVAVHALLSSKNLVGGIGQQVSAIAQQMNDSVASTTNAEAKINSRGFFSKLFFGGDVTSADIIAQEAAKNQTRIDSLTALLAQANISADVQVTLKAQITALQTAQARLKTLAEKEKAAWGLFSWRF
jgi:hypothetical protein